MAHGSTGIDHKHGPDSLAPTTDRLNTELHLHRIIGAALNHQEGIVFVQIGQGLHLIIECTQIDPDEGIQGEVGTIDHHCVFAGSDKSVPLSGCRTAE